MPKQESCIGIYCTQEAIDEAGGCPMAAQVTWQAGNGFLELGDEARSAGFLQRNRPLIKICQHPEELEGAIGTAARKPDIKP